MTMTLEIKGLIRLLIKKEREWELKRVTGDDIGGWTN